MKKVLTFAAAIVLFAGLASAQLGIHVGYAPQNYLTKSTVGNATLTDTANMNGFFVGIDYNVNLTGDLNLSVGLQGRYNSHSEETTVLGATTKYANTQTLIDVPILFNYGLNLSDDLKLSVFLGPTIDFALSGKSTTTVTGTPGGVLDGELEVDWYGDNSNRKKLDVALTAGLSLTFSYIKVFGGYNMGLMNLTSTDNTTLKGSNWFIGVGYNL